MSFIPLYRETEILLAVAVLAILTSSSSLNPMLRDTAFDAVIFTKTATLEDHSMVAPALFLVTTHKHDVA